MLELHWHVVCSTGKAWFLRINIKQLRYLYRLLLCITSFLFSLMANMLQPLLCLIFLSFITFKLHYQQANKILSFWYKIYQNNENFSIKIWFLLIFFYKYFENKTYFSFIFICFWLNNLIYHIFFFDMKLFNLIWMVFSILKNIMTFKIK